MQQVRIRLRTGQIIDALYNPSTEVFHGPRETSYSKNDVLEVLAGKLS